MEHKYGTSINLQEEKLNYEEIIPYYKGEQLLGFDDQEERI